MSCLDIKLPRTARGDNIVVIGYQAAGGAITNYDQTIIIGASACSSTVSANDNIVIGYNAAAGLTTGAGNIYIGTDAGNSNTAGTGNVIMGYQAANGPTVNWSNSTVIGYQAASGGTGPLFGVTAIGYQACINADAAASHVTAVGQSALAGGLTTLADDCTAIGYRAGFSLTSASRCTFVGSQAGMNTTIGAGNNSVYVGYNAGAFNVDGGNNVYIGSSAGGTATGADGCVVIGASASIASNFSSFCTVLGNLASGFNNDVVIGYSSSTTAGGTTITIGNSITNAQANSILIGHGATINATFGVALGNSSSVTGTNAVAVGYQASAAQLGVAVGANAIAAVADIQLGDNTIVAGQLFYNNYLVWDGPAFSGGGVQDVGVSNTGQAQIVPSDARAKTNVQSINGKKELDRIMQLRPVNFEWKGDRFKRNFAKPGFNETGLIAQEVSNVYPEYINKANTFLKDPRAEDRENGVAPYTVEIIDGNEVKVPKEYDEPEDQLISVNYKGFITNLISAVQQLKHENEKLVERLRVVEGKVNNRSTPSQAPRIHKTDHTIEVHDGTQNNNE